MHPAVQAFIDFMDPPSSVSERGLAGDPNFWQAPELGSFFSHLIINQPARFNCQDQIASTAFLNGDTSSNPMYLENTLLGCSTAMPTPSLPFFTLTKDLGILGCSPTFFSGSNVRLPGNNNLLSSGLSSSAAVATSSLLPRIEEVLSEENSAQEARDYPGHSSPTETSSIFSETVQPGNSSSFSTTSHFFTEVPAASSPGVQFSPQVGVRGNQDGINISIGFSIACVVM
jgi:hypothetical protein